MLIALVVLAALGASFFVKRYREAGAPGDAWTRTDEVFNDPSTSRVMRVWLDQGGSRHYVPEGERPSP